MSRKIALFFQEGAPVGVTSRSPRLLLNPAASSTSPLLNQVLVGPFLQGQSGHAVILPGAQNNPASRGTKAPHLFRQTWLFGDVAVLLVPSFPLTATQRHVAVIAPTPVTPLQAVIAGDLCDLCVCLGRLI